MFFLYLCIRQAALGKSRASSLSTRLQCLCIRQAALGKSRASSLSARLHCLCIRQAVLGKSRASSLSAHLHCLCIRQAALGSVKFGKTSFPHLAAALDLHYLCHTKNIYPNEKDINYSDAIYGCIFFFMQERKDGGINRDC